MFDKLSQMKNLYNLKRQADQMKKKMELITVEVQEGDFEITMNGAQNVEMVTENGEERPELKKLFNKAVKESQKVVAKKMRNEMSGLGLPGM